MDSRTRRPQLKIECIYSEIETLQELVEALLSALDRTIQPTITDADRIRYRCMVQDIRINCTTRKLQHRAGEAAVATPSGRCTSDGANYSKARLAG